MSENEDSQFGCHDVVMPRRYLCERCGGTGIQPSGCWNGMAYASEAGQCDLCDGVGLLGVIPEPWETRCCFHDERRRRCQLRDLHEGECLFEA